MFLRKSELYHRKVFSQDLKAGTFFETVKKEDYRRRRRRVKQKWVKRIDDSFLKLFGATTLGSESQSGQNQVERPTMHRPHHYHVVDYTENWSQYPFNSIFKTFGYLISFEGLL